MMDSGSSSSQPAVDWEIDLDSVNLESWFENIEAESLMNSGVDATTINPNNPSQPFMPTINSGTDLGGGSSNVSQSMMTVSSLTPSSSPTGMQNEGILSSAVKFISNISAQCSQTDFPQYHIVQTAQGPQYQQFLQPVFKGKDVQQPATHSLAEQSNMTFGYQKNQLFQMPPNQLLPCTGPVVNTQTGNLQQAIGSSCSLISGGWQQGNLNNLNYSAPVGSATPCQSFSINDYHKYIVGQIRKQKDIYSKELRKIRYNAMEMRTRANMDEENTYRNAISHLERLLTVLDTSRHSLLPNDYEIINNTLNEIVNYMDFHMNMPGASSQVQPLGGMMMQNNASPNNPYQRVTNLEATMSNFNQNIPLRGPHSQSTLSSVLSTTQQINLGPNTSSVIRSGSPISLFSNTTATHFPSHPLNHQPPVANQNFNFQKKKAPMNKTNDITKPKGRRGASPLSSGLVNQCPLPSNVNPIPQQTSVSSSNLDVNSVLSPHSIARSRFSLSSNSPAPSKPPMDPPSQEPETSKDQAFHLTEVIKPVSSNALISSSTDLSSIKKATAIIPDGVPSYLVNTYIQDKTNVMVEYDHESLHKMRRQLCVPSVYSDQFVSQGWEVCSTETSKNKRAKIQKNCAILEEIKEINSKLRETSMNVVMDTSEDNMNIFGAHEGTIVRCLFRNVCYLLGPQTGVSSEKMPEFFILLLVPANYPASSPRIIRSSSTELNNEPWRKLYDKMLIKFGLSLCGIAGIPSLGIVASIWDASARAIVTEFLKERGGESLISARLYGSWDNCMSSSFNANKSSK